MLEFYRYISPNNNPFLWTIIRYLWQHTTRYTTCTTYSECYRRICITRVCYLSCLPNKATIYDLLDGHACHVTGTRDAVTWCAFPPFFFIIRVTRKGLQSHVCARGISQYLCSPDHTLVLFVDCCRYQRKSIN